MPRRLASDRSAPEKAFDASLVRRLWRLLATWSDRRALERLSPHELRDIGLSEGERRDRFRDFLRSAASRWH